MSRIYLTQSTWFTLILGLSAGVFAQQSEEPVLEEVIVVGSQIKGAQVEGILPVTVVTTEDIGLTGAMSGDELLSSIPQIGETNFNESVTTGVNAARGDVGSINLRGLGTGNTLVLINGRRMVLHPGTQTESLVPVVTANSNTLPVGVIDRVEVLRDGAAAIYGTDAVAGVINYVLDKNYEGADFGLNFRQEEGTGLDQLVLTGSKGFKFNDDRTHIAISGSYNTRNGTMANAQGFTSNADLRPRVADQPLFEGDTQLDGRSTGTLWGQFDYDGGLGRLHIRPINLLRDNGNNFDAGDCSFALNDSSVCLDGGSGDRALRLNRNAARTLLSDRDRLNVFAFASHDISDATELYGEAGYYNAKTERVWEQASLLSNGRFEVPADYYWNPLGPVTFDDGRVNPNRLPGLDPNDVPVEGVGFSLRSFRALDAGPRMVEVENDSIRLLAGLRGQRGAWDWDSALLYSRAETTDTTDGRISATLFQQSLLLDTAQAYNLFLGGNRSNPTSPVSPTANSADVINPFLINVSRVSETSITLADFKVSRPDMFSLPAGDVGMGAGLEWRNEDFDENRDARSDGTTSFTDAITGDLVNVSDIVGSSASPDADGSRRVTSAYVEFLVPLLSDAPGARSLDAQIAGRFEDFSDVGSVFKPKVALSWYPIDQLQIRASYSEGFRAPNLVQIHQGELSVVNTRSDPARTDPVTGNIPSSQVQEIRAGNRDLEPEENESFTVGAVLTPFDGLTLTVDYWEIDQDGVVGILGGANHILYDNVLRQQGSFNPAVIRETTTDGSLGEVTQVFDRYINFQPRSIAGIDFGVFYEFDTSFGEFNLKFNAAKLESFNQEAGPITAQLVEAGVTAQNVGSLVEQEFRPEWRRTFSARWRNGNYGAGLFASYVGEVFDTQTRADNDTADPGAPLPVDDYMVVNIYGDYRLDNLFNGDARIRAGIRNVGNEEPPLSDEAYGYEGSLHSAMGRTYYLDFKFSY